MTTKCPSSFPNSRVTAARTIRWLFVRETQKFLAEVVESNRDHNDRPLFHEQLRPSMRAAWKEVQPLFPEVERSIHLLTDDQLRDHGLVGAQLRFKLAVIRVYHDCRRL